MKESFLRRWYLKETCCKWDGIVSQNLKLYIVEDRKNDAVDVVTHTIFSINILSNSSLLPQSSWEKSYITN